MWAAMSDAVKAVQMAALKADRLVALMAVQLGASKAVQLGAATAGLMVADLVEQLAVLTVDHWVGQ